MRNVCNKMSRFSDKRSMERIMTCLVNKKVLTTLLRTAAKQGKTSQDRCHDSRYRSRRQHAATQQYGIRIAVEAETGIGQYLLLQDSSTARGRITAEECPGTIQGKRNRYHRIRTEHQ